MARLSSVQVAALNNLHAAVGQMNSVSIRLATLKRVNTAADDPAGLVAAAELHSQISALEAADRNAARAEAIANVADAGLSKVGELVGRIESNLVAAAGGALSDAEVAALQIENDAALEAIDRIAATTSLGDVRLIDGSAGSLSFALSGRLDQLATFELPDVRTTALGSTAGRLRELASGGPLDLASGNHSAAADVLRAARSQVLEGRARLGAFTRFTVGAAREVAAAEHTNLTAALGGILDADVAAEASQLVRARLLYKTSISGLESVFDRASLVSELTKLPA